MTVTIHNKLSGDKIAVIIEASGDVPVTRILKQDEYHEALVAKLTAEAEELGSAAPDDRRTRRRPGSPGCPGVHLRVLSRRGGLHGQTEAPQAGRVQGAGLPRVHWPGLGPRVRRVRRHPERKASWTSILTEDQSDAVREWGVVPCGLTPQVAQGSQSSLPQTSPHPTEA